MNYQCPKCESKNVLVGNFVLSCGECGWSYLNEYPCSVCGDPSFSVAQLGGPRVYGCKLHSAIEQAKNAKTVSDSN